MTGLSVQTCDTVPMQDSNARRNNLALWFSCVGHFLFHYFAAMYFTIVIVLARDWQEISYENLIALWTPASILFGLLALPVGRLADRWSSAKMMIVMFIGMGLACAVCGLAEGGLSLKKTVEEFEKALILRALSLSNGVQKSAAQLLHVKPTTLSELIKRLKLKPRSS